MKIKWQLSIGYPVATREEETYIADEDYDKQRFDVSKYDQKENK